jgi:hypothetical protein
MAQLLTTLAALALRFRLLGPGPQNRTRREPDRQSRATANDLATRNTVALGK